MVSSQTLCKERSLFQKKGLVAEDTKSFKTGVKYLWKPEAKNAILLPSKQGPNHLLFVSNAGQSGEVEFSRSAKAMISSHSLCEALSFQNRELIAEERYIGEAVLSCPLELIEIYSSKQASPSRFQDAEELKSMQSLPEECNEMRLKYKSIKQQHRPAFSMQSLPEECNEVRLKHKSIKQQHRPAFTNNADTSTKKERTFKVPSYVLHVDSAFSEATSDKENGGNPKLQLHFERGRGPSYLNKEQNSDVSELFMQRVHETQKLYDNAQSCKGIEATNKSGMYQSLSKAMEPRYNAGISKSLSKAIETRHNLGSSQPPCQPRGKIHNFGISKSLSEATVLAHNLDTSNSPREGRQIINNINTASKSNSLLNPSIDVETTAKIGEGFKNLVTNGSKIPGRNYLNTLESLKSRRFISFEKSCKYKDQDPVSIKTRVEKKENIPLYTSLCKNENQENQRVSRKYTLKCRRTSNFSSHENRKYVRNEDDDSRVMKLDLIKRESSVETQIGRILNCNDPVRENKSKLSTKSMVQDRKGWLVHGVEGELNDSKFDKESGLEKLKRASGAKNDLRLLNQAKQPIGRQKCRSGNTPQPIWKPPGVVRIPSKNSVTSVMPKTQSVWTHGKEKVNLIMNTKESKQRKIKNSYKKTLLPEIRSTRVNHPSSLEIEKLKILKKRSDTGAKIRSKSKPRPGTPRTASKYYDVRLDGHSSDITHLKPFKNTLWHPTQRSLITAVNSVKSSLKNESKHHTENIPQTHSLDSHTVQTKEACTLLKDSQKHAAQFFTNEAIAISEEPMQHTDPPQALKSQNLKQTLNANKLSPQFTESLESISKIPTFSQSHEPTFSSYLLERPSEALNTNINSRFDVQQSVANVSCTAKFSSSSDTTTRILSSKCCQTSLNSLSSASAPSTEDETNIEPKTSLEKTLEVSKETEKRLIRQKKLRGITNHVPSLITLKELLYLQGVNANCIERAGRQLKEKRSIEQKTVDNTSRRKSVIFADTLQQKSKCAALGCSSEVIYRYGNPVWGDVRNSGTRLISKASCRSKESSIDNPCTNVEDKEDTVSRCFSKSLRIKPRNINNSICRKRIHKDASTQTSFLHQFNSTQTVLEECGQKKTKDSVATQTDVSSTRHIGTDYEVALMKDTSTSMQALLNSVNDSFTETGRTVASKSIGGVTDFISANKTAREGINCVHAESQFCICVIDKSREQLREQTVLNDNSKEKRPKNLTELLNDLYANYEEQTGRNYRKSNNRNALRSLTSNTASSSFSVFNLITERSEHPESLTSSLNGDLSYEVIIALQIIALRVHNIRQAINIYNQNLKEQLSQKSVRQNTMKKRGGEFQNFRGRPEELINDCTLHRDVSSFCNIAIEESELKMGNIPMHIELQNFTACTEFQINQSVETSKDKLIELKPDTCKWLQSEVSEKFHSTLTDVEPSMKHSQYKMRDRRLQNRRLSLDETYSAYLEPYNVKVYESNSVSTILSRKNVLPLVYGIVCLTVFWCLQFSFKCEFMLYDL